MKLTKEQIGSIITACEKVDYGAVTIKLNKTAKFIDVVVENQVRLYSEPTVNTSVSKDMKY